MNTNSKSFGTDGQKITRNVAQPILGLEFNLSSPFSAVMVLDKAGAIVELNESALQLLGCDKDQAVGHFYGCFVTTLQCESSYEEILSTADPLLREMVAGKHCFCVSALVRSVDGHRRTVDGIVSELREEKNGDISSVIIFRPLDEQRQWSAAKH